MTSLQVLRELIIKSQYADYIEFLKTEKDGSASYAECDKWGIIENNQITLAQVLIVLEKEFEREYHKMIFQDNKFMFICARDEAPQFYWELTKDLDEQSDSTIKTLLKLMKGE